jgi:hypothetical protein
MKTATLLKTILMLLLSLTAYGQISVKIIDNDTLFVMSKDFAAMVAMRFDSLVSCKRNLQDCDRLVSELDAHRQDLVRISILQKEQSESLRKEIWEKDQIIGSYKRQEAIQDNMRKDYRRLTKNRNFWRVAAIVLGSGAVGTTIFAILK